MAYRADRMVDDMFYRLWQTELVFSILGKVEFFTTWVVKAVLGLAGMPDM